MNSNHLVSRPNKQEQAALRLEKAFEESKEIDSVVLLDRDADEVKMGPASAWVVELAFGARRGAIIREGSEVRLLNRDANMYLTSLLPSDTTSSSQRVGMNHRQRRRHMRGRGGGRSSDYLFLGLLPTTETDPSQVDLSLFRVSTWQGHQQRSVALNQGERAASDELREEIRMDKPVVLTHVLSGAVLEPLSLTKMDGLSQGSGQGKPMRPVVLQSLHNGKKGKPVSVKH